MIMVGTSYIFKADRISASDCRNPPTISCASKSKASLYALIIPFSDELKILIFLW